jgi:ABC-2 type transporter
MMSSSLYRLIGASIRAIVAGVSTAVILMLTMFIGSGFVLLRKQIPGWWIWMFWISPLQYTFTGLANNEFSGKSYKDRGELPESAAPDGLGKYVLDEYQFNQGNKWRCVPLHARACL